jgi:putative oxidoreductase
MVRTSSRANGFTHSVLRVGAGLLFMAHGAQKLFGWFGGFGGVEGATAPLVSQFGVAGILELVGGGLIALGMLTRPVAFLLAIEMVVAYFQVHAPRGPWPLVNEGELALLYFLVFQFLLGNGAGPFSVDASYRRVRHGAIGKEEVEVTREYRVPGRERPLGRPRGRERERGDD